MEGEKRDMEPVTKSEFDRLVLKVDNMDDTMKTEINNIKIQQGIQDTRVTSIEKTLDKISNNVSRTMWTVIAGIAMMVVNYFWNPPTPKVEPETVTQFITTLFGG